ncbi:MAG: radical SAM protein, partial [Gammaproteobacteria bacterium]
MLTRTHTPLETQTVVDRLGRQLHDLRISVIDRCNFRCPYCMPEEDYPEHHQFFRPEERLSFDEIIRLTRLFADLGVKKVRITGGEPLLRKNLDGLVSELVKIESLEDVALTTNGVLLASQAAALKAAGLQRVTVSLDSLDEELFSRMSGGRGRVD